MKIKDMPKLESPFKREQIGKKYYCVGNILPEYKWILDKDKVIATEKFDGTNISVYIEDGKIKHIFNRNNRVDIWTILGSRIYTGILNAIQNKYFKPEMLLDGQYFGELIGDKIQTNSYKDKHQVWMSFDYVKKHYSFKFYYDWLDENKGTLEDFSELLKTLQSIYMREKGEVIRPEGIVFHNKDTGEMCKLRCDMFDWYTGAQHKIGEE